MLKQLVDQFTTVSLIGVDIGTAALKIVEVARAEGRIALRHCAVASVEGADATPVLKRLVDEARVDTNRAALGLAAPGLSVRPFQFPLMPKKELTSAIQLEAEQAILNGHSPNEMAIDWHTFPSSQGAIRGLLAVVPKRVLASRLEMAKLAGLRPTVIDVEGLALWNAYWTLVGAAESSPKTVLLMNIGARTTNLVIAKGSDELVLVRDFQLGGQALVKAQEREWLSEVQDSLGYARANAGLRTLDEVYVTGGGSGPKLIPLMRSITQTTVTFWNPLNDIEREASCPPIDDAVGPLLAIAIGLSLRQPS